MMPRITHVFAGTVAALEAVLESQESLTSLDAVHRIASRIHATAFELGNAEIAAIALRLRSANTWVAAQSLSGELRDHLAGVIGQNDAHTNILIIEDDRLTAEVLRDELKAADRDVMIATSAAEAERLLRERDIALVLLDLVLPDADGRELLLRFRAAAGTRAVPILVITGRTDAATHAECFALGADGLLLKPASGPLVRAATSALLQHAAQRRLEGRLDPLTGLANRVAFMEALRRAAPLVRRQGSSLAIAMIDIDHFKSVNDQYGHAMGDEVLRTCAQAIAETLRISDVVARWGGEEFCAFFPDTTTEGAITALNKALTAVRDLQFTPPDGAPFGITFSAGLAMFSPGTPVEATIEAADHLLYLAKHGGRNRIASTADAAAPPRQLILLVEDDDSVASMVGKVLMREGFDVHRCANGSAAHAALEEKKFVLAIFDVNLPDITGFELLTDMRQRRHLARVPVVMLTGSAEESDVVRGFELGVNDYMTKPFYATELLARIRRLLKR